MTYLNLLFSVDIWDGTKIVPDTIPNLLRWLLSLSSLEKIYIYSLSVVIGSGVKKMKG